MAAKAGLAADKQFGYLKFHQALMALPGPIKRSVGVLPRHTQPPA
ncbi:hypothetical protein SBA6_300061 [Candidatus Sulfopaludibacter sp. SbA6]|nr:hypothetical protein SBA6_300061 [Candidatus Sulfopaludibacter sp. SbA6]